MKRMVSILLMLSLIVSFSSVALAGDTFQVTPSIVQSNTETKSIKAIMPIFKGFKGTEELNEKIINLTLDAIGEANATDKSMEKIREEIKKNGEPGYSAVVTLDMNYDYLKEGDILSLRLVNYSYSGGAHGMTQLITVNSNTSTGEIYKFKDLFKDSVDYNSAIKNLIFEQLDKNPEIYFSNYKETISNKNGEYSFYIDGDKIVVYFDLYEIAPYAAGIRQTIIDSEDIKELLKEEVYNSIKDGEKRSSIIINGEGIKTDKELIVKDEEVLIPLRVVAESLGYEVNWNPNDGAIVGDIIVNRGELQSVVVDGSTYVPRSFFAEVLGEYISFDYNSNDKMIVKVFSNNKEYIAKHPYDKLYQFQKPINKEEAINMYAKAVYSRQGLIQYGLMNNSLRKEKYKEFKDMNFVTGVSSPWIDSYEIKQVDENNYKIDFTLKTSVPTEEFLSTVKVELIEEGEFINISNIE